MAFKSKGRALPLDGHVGRRLRLRRQMLNMSQSELGKVAGITFQQVQKYERGANRISASRLQQFANVLDVDIAYFFEGAQSGERKRQQAALENVEDFVASEEGRALIAAFMRIKDKNIRKRLVDVARAAGA
jgi:transcriptional regulator with XRE-family HTH domain